MSTVGEDKAKRKAAQQRVTAYHEQQLAELQAHVRAALDAHARGETDAFDVDDVIHHYTRAARALWKTCVMPGNPEATAWLLADVDARGEATN